MNTNGPIWRNVENPDYVEPWNAMNVESDDESDDESAPGATGASAASV